jgi:hypothetical protein
MTRDPGRIEVGHSPGCRQTSQVDLQKLKRQAGGENGAWPGPEFRESAGSTQQYHDQLLASILARILRH